MQSTESGVALLVIARLAMAVARHCSLAGRLKTNEAFKCARFGLLWERAPVYAQLWKTSRCKCSEGSLSHVSPCTRRLSLSLRPERSSPKEMNGSRESLRGMSRL